MSMPRNAASVFATAGLLVLGACAGAPEGEMAAPNGDDSPAANNTLTEQEQSEGWELVFDGTATAGWHTYGKQGTQGWEAIDGELVRVAGGGDIVTDRVYQDFEMVLDWKVEEGGNSGVFIHANESAPRIFEGAPEVQILDDAVHPDGQNPLTSAGANYALHAAPRGVVNPAGEWNSIRIRVEGPRIQQWMNGQLIVDYERWTPEWEALVAGSKFQQWPVYGTYHEGPIGLQDHGDRVYFRNIKARVLNP